MATITRTVTVAAGVFAPGHIGELTRYLPFELVDDVLAQTRTVQQRLRALPSRTGVYFVLALGLFPADRLRPGVGQVVSRPGRPGRSGGADGVGEALRELRRRLGPAPFKALFEVVAGPLARPRTPGTCFAAMRTVAFLAALHRTGEMLLARGRSQRVPPVLGHLADGSYMSDLDGLAVRIIEAQVRMSVLVAVPDDHGLTGWRWS
jgi:hypothetical protein